MASLIKGLTEGKQCSICMDEVKDNGTGHIRIGEEEVNVSMKTNPFVTEVASVIPDNMTYRCELKGVFQGVSSGDNREGVKPTALGAAKPAKPAKPAKETEKEAAVEPFLSRIGNTPSCSLSTLRLYTIHYLLLHTGMAMNTICSAVMRDLTKAKKTVSPKDRERIKLLVVSLCYATRSDCFDIRKKVVDSLQLSSFAWTPEEKRMLAKWTKKSVKQKEKTTKQKEKTTKQKEKTAKQKEKATRRKKVKASDTVKENDSYVELQLTIPNHQLRFSESILSPTITEHMETNMTQFEEYRQKVETGVLSTEEMNKLHADCILLKRILDRRSQRHEADLASVNTVITTLQGPDAEIVKEYKRRLEEKREKDVRIMKDYAEKMHAFLSEMYPAFLN
ncbi:hypothetical protein WA556_004736 [Blastocystis sp. ATCC 50177/Nand II]